MILKRFCLCDPRSVTRRLVGCFFGKNSSGVDTALRWWPMPRLKKLNLHREQMKTWKHCKTNLWLGLTWQVTTPASTMPWLVRSWEFCIAIVALCCSMLLFKTSALSVRCSSSCNLHAGEYSKLGAAKPGWNCWQGQSCILCIHPFAFPI